MRLAASLSLEQWKLLVTFPDPSSNVTESWVGKTSLFCCLNGSQGRDQSVNNCCKCNCDFGRFSILSNLSAAGDCGTETLIWSD